MNLNHNHVLTLFIEGKLLQVVFCRYLQLRMYDRLGKEGLNIQELTSKVKELSFIFYNIPFAIHQCTCIQIIDNPENSSAKITVCVSSIYT